jgi:hypothetical protein
MAKQTQVFTFRGVNMNCATFVNADAITEKTVISAGADDSVLRHLSITSRSEQTERIEFLLNDGVASRLLMTAMVPAGAGSNGSAGAFDAFGSGLLAFFRALPMKEGWSLNAKPVTAVAGEVVVTAITDDF